MPSTRSIGPLFLTLPLLILAPSASPAEESGSKAVPREIIERANETLTATPTMTATMTMRIIKSDGTEIERKAEIQRKRIDNRENYLIRFTSPPSLKDVAFLVNERKGGEANQYLYYPELGRARKIASSSKTQKFMNSDFTYEDMAGFNTEGEHSLIRTERCTENVDCYVIDSIPKDAQGYNRARSWIRKDLFLPVEIDFFKDSDKPIKKLFFRNIQEIPGPSETVPFATEWTMEDIQNKSKTVLTYKDIDLKATLSDRLFHSTALQQGIR